MGLHEELLYCLEYHRHNIAFEVIEDETINNITYERFAYDVYGIREELALENASCVAIIGTNCYEWFCNMYASVLSGKRTLLCDALLPLNELEQVLTNMEVEMVLYSKDLWELAREIRKINSSISICEFKQNSSFPIEEDVQKTEFEEGKVICLTSGTTSYAKGVVISTEALSCNARNLAKVLIGKKNDRVYTSLPLHHLYAIAKTLSFFHIGVTLCLGSMRTVAKDIKLFHPNILLTVPTVVDYLDKIDGFTPEITAIAVSGCKCEKQVEMKCEKRGIFLQNIYGSSETAGGIALNMHGDPIEYLTAIPGIIIRIAKDEEIVLQPSGMMEEYYKAPEETREKIRDGWLYTGDLGYLDEKGCLHITGRKKDMIAMENGDKIYCAETDEQLCLMPGVAEAAVIYVEKELIAVIFPKENTTAESIKLGIRQYNSNQQIIRRISNIWIINESLPRTSTGKLLRNELKKRYIEKEGRNGL